MFINSLQIQYLVVIFIMHIELEHPRVILQEKVVS